MVSRHLCEVFKVAARVYPAVTLFTIGIGAVQQPEAMHGPELARNGCDQPPN